MHSHRYSSLRHIRCYPDRYPNPPYVLLNFLTLFPTLEWWHPKHPNLGYPRKRNPYVPVRTDPIPLHFELVLKLGWFQALLLFAAPSLAWLAVRVLYTVIAGERAFAASPAVIVALNFVDFLACNL